MEAFTRGFARGFILGNVLAWPIIVALLVI